MYIYKTLNIKTLLLIKNVNLCLLHKRDITDNNSHESVTNYERIVFLY